MVATMGETSKGLQELIGRAKSEPSFLFELLADPSEVSRRFELSELERQALIQSAAEGLITLVSRGVLSAGCGDTPTCPVTCPVTCADTNPLGAPQDLQGSGPVSPE